jgi:TolA-binding protein
MERKRDKGPSPVWMVAFIVFLLVVVTALLSGCNILNPKTGSLQGTVHRETSTDSAPLEDALVTVSGSTGTAETDGNGYFFLNDVPAGKRTVTIIREGYIKLQLLNVSIEPETVNEVNFGNPVVLQPKEDRAIYDIALEYYEAENYELALNSFQDLLIDFPDTIWADAAQYYIAWCNLSMEEYTQAITEFENLLLNYSDSKYRENSQYYIGWTYETKLGLPISAILAYYTFLFDYPDSQWADNAQLGIGNCYYDTEEYSNAITEYQMLIDNYPSSDLLPQAQYSIAQTYRVVSYRNTAIGKYEELILLYPDSEYCGPSQYYIGYCYYEKGEYQISIDEFQKVIDNYFNSTWPDEDRQVAPSAQFYIGWCYEKLELWEEAIAAYQVVIDYYPGSTFSNGDSIPAYCQERIDWINENKTTGSGLNI